MFNLDKVIADSVTFRPSSMFETDIKANAFTWINIYMTMHRRSYQK